MQSITCILAERYCNFVNIKITIDIFMQTKSQTNLHLNNLIPLTVANVFVAIDLLFAYINLNTTTSINISGVHENC